MPGRLGEENSFVFLQGPNRRWDIPPIRWTSELSNFCNYCRQMYEIYASHCWCKPGLLWCLTKKYACTSLYSCSVCKNFLILAATRAPRSSNRGMVRRFSGATRLLALRKIWFCRTYKTHVGTNSIAFGTGITKGMQFYSDILTAMTQLGATRHSELWKKQELLNPSFPYCNFSSRQLRIPG